MICTWLVRTHMVSEAHVVCERLNFWNIGKLQLIDISLWLRSWTKRWPPEWLREGGTQLVVTSQVRIFPLIHNGKCGNSPPIFWITPPFFTYFQSENCYGKPIDWLFDGTHRLKIIIIKNQRKYTNLLNMQYFNIFIMCENN